MSKWLRSSLLAAVLALPSVSLAASITAGGSTAIFPALSKWAKGYEQATGTQINYQPVGSGGGIKGLSSKTFVFAASDMPLSSQQLAKNNWMQFPAIIGGIVVAINLPNIKTNQITLNGKTLADIYLGKVKYWDNTEIKSLNKNVRLPHMMIIPIHRADGSGTTYNFSNYLSKVSPQWKKQIGFNTEIAWPGMGLGAKGNAGVAAQVEHVPGSIGYVEYAYALENHMVYTKMINSANESVRADALSFAAAAKNAHWASAKDFNLILTNQPGDDSWPIVATTFVLLPKTTDNDTKASVKFFSWCYKNGKMMAEQLDYVPMPDSVVTLIKKQWQAAKLA